MLKSHDATPLLSKTMTKEDFIREFVLRYAIHIEDTHDSIDKVQEFVICKAKIYAELLFPTDPDGKHETICKLLRNCNLQKLVSLPTEERYVYLSEVLDSHITEEDKKLFSHLKPNK